MNCSDGCKYWWNDFHGIGTYCVLPIGKRCPNTEDEEEVPKNTVLLQDTKNKEVKS